MKVRQRGRGQRVGVRRELVLACGVAALALVVVAITAVLASWQVARGQALKEAERSTRRLADVAIAPLLVETLKGNRQRAAELERAIDTRISDGDLTEITVWARDGTIVYSDDLRQVGTRTPPPKEVVSAIDRGQVSSGFERQPEVKSSDGSAAERYVEVYVPYTLSGQPPLAFEAYYNYSRVQNTARGLARSFIPLVLAPLLALQFIQIPIAVSLARRVRSHEAERAELFESTLAASERERSRIAADLHDGPIQDIAGVSYALGAIAPSVSADHQPLMTQAQQIVTHSIDSLRRLMVDLYPPDLDTRQLPATLSDLTVPLREKGLSVTTELHELPELDNASVTTLYRVAREALANVAEHSRATAVRLSLESLDNPSTGSALVRLVIHDDGVGLDLSRLDRRAEGHLGLRLLRDRVESVGGLFELRDAPEGGTLLQVELPVVTGG
jgi:two-component system NarL family sensor kinase